MNILTVVWNFYWVVGGGFFVVSLMVVFFLLVKIFFLIKRLSPPKFSSKEMVAKSLELDLWEKSLNLKAKALCDREKKLRLRESADEEDVEE